MHALQLSVQVCTALLQGTILEIVLQVVCKVHHLSLEDLHLVNDFVELYHILYDYLLLKV